MDWNPLSYATTARASHDLQCFWAGQIAQLGDAVRAAAWIGTRKVVTGDCLAVPG